MSARSGVRVLLVVCALASPAAAQAASRPDLTVTALALGARTAVIGSTLAVADTTANRGRRAAGSSRTALSLSRDARPSRDDRPLGVRSVRRLAPRASSRRTLRVAVPSLAAGSYHVIACADARRSVREASERDNCRVSRASLKVVAPPPVSPAATASGNAATPAPAPGGAESAPPAAPPAPAGLTAAPDDAQHADLSWSPSPGAASYRVLRGTASGGPYDVLADGLSATSYRDQALTAGQRYFYRVQAIGPGGTSPSSAEASALGCADAHGDDTPGFVAFRFAPLNGDALSGAGDADHLCRGDVDWSYATFQETRTTSGIRMRATVVLTPAAVPPGEDGNLDLFVYANPGGAPDPGALTLVGQSTNAGTAEDRVTFSWGENDGDPDNGTSDRRTLWFKVVGAGGGAADDYTLDATGGVGA